MIRMNAGIGLTVGEQMQSRRQHVYVIVIGRELVPKLRTLFGQAGRGERDIKLDGTSEQVKQKVGISGDHQAEVRLP